METNRTQIINIKVKPNEKEKIKEKAKSKGLKVSEYIREKILK